MARSYAPPAGYYDLPMLWRFDCSALANGINSLNNNIDIFAGYGDFILRRIVGLDRVLSNVGGLTSGRFQIRDSIGRNLQLAPQFIGPGGVGLVQNSGQMAILPELVYPENHGINFDLWNILLHGDGGGVSSFGAQVGFHGVRRFKGASPLADTYKYNPKTYSYENSLLLPVSGATLNPPIRLNTQIVNYDFELWEIRFVYQRPAFNIMGSESAILNAIANSINFPGAAGNGITLTIVKPALPNQPLTITSSVSGKTVTVSLATDAAANNTTTGYTLAAAINNDPGASQLLKIIVIAAGSQGITTGVFVLAGGGSNLNPNNCWSLMTLYDQNGVATSYGASAVTPSAAASVADLFLNRLSYYSCGALVPPLFYRKDSVIRLDVQSLTGGFVANLLIDFVGRQRFPC